MAARKKARRKKARRKRGGAATYPIRCKTCRKKLNNPQHVGRHYRDSPECQSPSSRARSQVTSTLPTIRKGESQPALRYCTQCGCRRRPGWRFCGNCGGKL